MAVGEVAESRMSVDDHVAEAEIARGLTAGSFVSRVRIASLREVSLRILSYCSLDGSWNASERRGNM